VRTWSYTLDLLERAHDQHGPGQMLIIVHQALTNCRYLFPSASHSRRTLLSQAWEIYDWMEEKGITPCQQTMDILLAVACKHGNKADIEYALQCMTKKGHALTLFSVNTLLDRAASTKDAKECAVLMKKMNAMNLQPDETTFNTLLKLCARTSDVKQAEKVGV
jgi:hypothetical protein